MISLYAAMLVTLGFLMAALVAVVLLPSYRRRIERFATEAVKRALPLTEDEIRADKDRLKAAFAMDVHKLEMKVDEAAIAAARQSVEVNRRDARIHELEQGIAAQKLRIDEHENARRVLEQAILDRLPKVERRLADARKLLAERDADIALLAETSSKQTSALEEATQINVQQAEELNRLRAALDTRAARPREAVGDPRFDGEVALRTEIEMLRAKSRDQAAVIERLKSAAKDVANDRSEAARAEAEIKRLRDDLAEAEADLLQIRSSESSTEASRARLDARVRELEAEARDHAAEIASLKAALKSYESAEGEPSAPGIAAKAEISALQAEIEQQRLTIQSLRADVASGSEKLARQAQHFRDELRRLGAGASMDGGRREDRDAPKPSLADRLAAPRPPRLPDSAHEQAGASAVDGARAGGFLRAVAGGSVENALPDGAVEILAPSSERPQSDVSPRRPRLLERLGGYDKTSS